METRVSYDVVRRDAKGRELTRCRIIARDVPAGMTREGWAREVAASYTRTLHDLAGADAGAWHFEESRLA